MSRASRQLVDAVRADDAAGIARAVTNGADVNVRDDDGDTAIYTAAEKRHMHAVRALLEHGADANRATGMDWTPLRIAAHNGDVDMVAALCSGKGALVDLPDAKQRTPLYIAAKRGFAGTVEALLDRGADANALAEGGATPLYAACCGGHVDAVTVLLARGAHTSVSTSDGSTPLHVAAALLSKRCVLALLAAGADPTKQDVASDFRFSACPTRQSPLSLATPSRKRLWTLCRLRCTSPGVTAQVWMSLPFWGRSGALCAACCCQSQQRRH